MRRLLFCAVAVGVLTMTAPAAGPGPSARELLSDEEMAEARGGVLVAGGVAFEFGAVAKTFEDGVLRLQTQVTWTSQGAQIERVVGADVTRLGQDLSAAATNSLRGQAAQPGAAAGPASVDASKVLAAVLNGTIAVDPAAASPASRVSAADTRTVYATGSGANIIQQVSQGQLLNVLLNTGSNRQFAQSTEITLTLPGFAATQADIARQLNGMRITNEIRDAIGAGAR
jgi:hypothetical protein